MKNNQNRYYYFKFLNFLKGAVNFQLLEFKIELVFFFKALFSFFIIYFSTMKEIRKSILLKDNVFVSDEIKTPAVYGIFRPKIVIPNNYNEKNLKYILLHENMHIKSFDNFFRVVAVFLVCFHWFNPFCLLFLKLFYIDMELSCDERVLLRLKEDERKEYARTLLSSLEKTVVFVSLFGGAKIKTRINNIISYKKITLLSSVFFIFFIALTFYFLLTNA
jgi:beta-lactamase regulating signal transducer with metallopeptidase domain